MAVTLTPRLALPQWGTGADQFSRAQMNAAMLAVEAALVASAGVIGVRVATTAAATLATGFENGDTHDGVVLATNDVILIKNQAAPADDGVYIVNAAGAPTRLAAFDAAIEIRPSTLVTVAEGTVNADTTWMLSTNAAITVGTTGLVFVQVSAVKGSATGDIVYYNGTNWVLLSAGTNGHVLTLAGGVPSWAAASSSGLTKLYQGSANTDQNGITTTPTTLTGSSSGSISIPAAGALHLATMVFQKKTGAGYGLLQLQDVTAGAVVTGNDGVLASQSIDGYDTATIVYWHDPATGPRTYELRGSASVNTINVPRWSYTILG